MGRIKTSTRQLVQKYCKKHNLTDVNISRENGQLYVYCTDQNDIDFRIGIALLRSGNAPRIFHAINKRDYFENIARTFHGDKYGYNYIKNDMQMLDKVEIICPIHGVFEQRAADHTYKNAPRGCPKCAKKR